MRDLEDLGNEISQVSALLFSMCIFVRPVSGDMFPETGAPSPATMEKCFDGIREHLQRISNELIEMSREINLRGSEGTPLKSD